MANDTAAAAPATRGTARETISAPITPVDERRFESEIRRIDTSGADEKKNREKFETRIEKAVSDLRDDVKDLRGEIKDLRGEMNAEFKNLRGEVNARIDRLDARMWWVFGAVILSILFPIAMKYL
jgi:peptidoglycan hydrolase CwlO-like protein